MKTVYLRQTEGNRREHFAWRAGYDEGQDRAFGATRFAALFGLYHSTETPDETLAVIAAILREHGQHRAAEIVEEIY